MKLLTFHEGKALRSPHTPLPAIGELINKFIGDREDDNRIKKAYDLLFRIGNPAARASIAGILNSQDSPLNCSERLTAAIVTLLCDPTIVVKA